jgi:hypothetical protein
MAKPQRPTAILRRLERWTPRYDTRAAAAKLDMLRALSRARLPRAGEVFRLHETLCFLRAYPDDPEVLAQVERALDAFSRRADLRRHREALADTGIAGTPTRFRFFWFTALWLARRWPDRLRIEWEDFASQDGLEGLLPLLLPYSESTALDELTGPPREWLQRLRGPREADATFLIRRFAATRGGPFLREKLFEDLDVPIRLSPGPDTPSRTRARYAPAPIRFQTRPLARGRPPLGEEILRPPVAVRPLPAAEGGRLVDLAREAMVTRGRDLNVFEHADARDVRLVDCGGGLEFACLGVIPERRLMLESVYGFLTLKNGVPIGYVLASALFGSSEIAYNVFETFRGGEAAAVFGRVLGMVRRIFGSDAFVIGADQLGLDNEEGLRSGAWWFYYKMGFRPRALAVKRVLTRELARMRADPAHRSSLATLTQLSSESMFYFLGEPRPDVLGRIALGGIGLAVSRLLAERFGADREAGVRVCARQAARLLGVPPAATRSRRERLAWERWGPLVAALPGVERWRPAEKRALATIVRAKWGARESDFVPLFDRHRKLRRALLELARG